MTKINTEIGDVFSVRVNDDCRRYFQYIANDLTQLNSDVIRCFKKKYSINSNFNFNEIVSDDVDFYVHCVTKLGMKMGFWQLVGNSDNLGDTKNILFNTTVDCGNPKITTSENWWVWRINEDQRYVGKLSGENTKSEMGMIVNPENLVHRIKFGNYMFEYPVF